MESVMEAVKRKNRQDFTEGKLIPKMLLFALPLIATGVLQLLFNTADTVVVGRWGGDTKQECEFALAAVGSCGALSNLIVDLFMGLSVGAGVCVAHDIGAKQYDEVNKVVQTSVLAALICGVIVTVFGLCMARPLLTLMGTDPAVLDEAVPYMSAYFCGMPASMLYNFCASMLRSSGDTKHPLAFLSVAGVINILLNMVTVIVLRLGALGVGIATAVSQIISCVLIVLYMMRSDGPCHLDIRHLRIYGDKLRKILVIGLPAGLQSCLFSFSNVIIQSSVNSFPPVVVAGNTAASNLDSYIYRTQNAMYHTALTFVGQNVGARKYNRLRQCVLGCVGLVTAIGITVGGLMLFFGKPLLGIYTPGNETAIEAGMNRMRIMCTTYFLCGIMEVGCGTLRGLGKSITPMMVSLLGTCVFRVGWIFTVFAVNPTLPMLYVSYPISWFVTAFTQFIFCFVLIRQVSHSKKPGTTQKVSSENSTEKETAAYDTSH